MARLLPLLLGGVTIAGCGEVTALDLQLVADPNVNGEAALAQQLERLRVVVDSPEGLYPADAEHSDSVLQLINVDSDPFRELVAHFELDRDDQLPEVRLERGGLSADATLGLRIDGLGRTGDGDTLGSMAAGGVEGIGFDAGQVGVVRIPFNLRQEFRAPRVSQVFPEDGSQLQVEVDSVVLIFSKAMRAASLQQAGVLGVTRVDGGADQPLTPTSIEVTQLYAGGPSKAELRFAAGLSGGTYRVRVSQGALDLSGRSLDQVAMQSGNQPFTSQFLVADKSATMPMTEQMRCDSGGEYCPPGLTCLDSSCQPLSCPADCGAGAVCQPATHSCVGDCRIHGSYGGCAGDEQCDAQSGLCQAR